MKPFKVSAALLLVAFIVSGCASTKVTRSSQPASERYARPDHIVVHDVAATAADISADPSLAASYTGPMLTRSVEYTETGRELGALVARELVKEIQDMGLPAFRAADQQPTVGDLVLKGYFVSIDKGSTTKRVAVGFGSGSAELRTVIIGYEMTENGLREVGSAEIDSGGGKSPGMLLPIAVTVATANPVGLVVGGAVKATQEVTGSSKVEGAAKRTAKTIGEELRMRFERQGWIERQ